MPSSMSPLRVFALTLLTLVAFASNSLLCRLALKHTSIDAATFTTIRLIAGALTLYAIVRLRSEHNQPLGSWRSALALFAYAVTFSYAYVSLDAGTGALLLFGAVQTSMIGYGLWSGERFSPQQWLGLACALGGLIGLLTPGTFAPPFLGSALMLSAGVAWGIYSLRGKGAGDPTCATAGNFLRTIPLTIGLSAAAWPRASFDTAGVLYALASGALASGIGYSVWYTAMRGLKATSAATVQLSVPAIAAVGGVVFLGESITLRLLLSSAAILGGIALVMWRKESA